MSARNWLGTTTIIGLATVGLFAGCGGGSSKPLTVTDFCAQKADKECQVVARCATVKMTDCLSRRADECMQFATTAQTAPRVFKPGAVKNCIDKTASVYSKTAPITPSDFADMDDACNYVFQGDVAKDKACTIKYDCTGTLICDKSLCADKANKNKGDLCGNPGEVCAAGSYCTTDGTVMRCLAKKGMGDTCDATAPCLENLRCSEGTCKDRVGQGESCTSNDDCVTAAPYCDKYAGNKCDPGLSFAAGSPSCTDFGGTSTTGSGGSGGAAGGSDGGGGASGGSGGAAGGSDGGAAETGGTDAAGTDA